MDNIDELFNELYLVSESGDVERIIRALIEIASYNMRAVVDLAVKKINENQFEGSKWSSLALSMQSAFRSSDEPGEILAALVKYDQDNGAYLNNLGVFMELRGRVGQAIEYYARAYATDYRAHGHEKAADFPAWTNLHRIASSVT